MANESFDPSYLERVEYYWENGKVVEYKNERNHPNSNWPLGSYSRGNLIVGINRVHNQNEYYLGPQATPDRLTEAILRHSRYFCNNTVKDIGTEIPPELLEKVINKTVEATDRVTRQWESTGNEEGQSGLFAGTINDLEKFQDGEWEATIRVQVFSTQKKEPKVGADIGIIVDLRNGTKQVVKASLVQAKRTKGIPKSTMELPDIAEQIPKMRKTTNESYGLIYSDEGTYFVHNETPDEQIDVKQFFKDQFICTRGDRSYATIAQAYDHSAVIDVTVATGAQS